MRLAALALALAAVAPAQIVLKPNGGDGERLTPKTLDVVTKIRGGVAETLWTYVFTHEGWGGQADFIIALPEGGVATGFAYWYKGERVDAKVVEKERAKEIFRIITAPRSDPALVVLIGRRTLRVRIFPLDPSADLKVEIRMVQPLRPTAQGMTMTLPLRAAGETESLRASVSADGPVFDSLGRSRGSSSLLETRGGRAPDWRLTVARPRRALAAELRAGRSGGADGYMALTLSPSRALARPRLVFSGVEVFDALVETPSGWRPLKTLGRVAAGGTVRVVGRYRNARPGASLTLAGDGFRGMAVLAFPTEAEPNGPAVKLWAWAKIGASRNREEIVELSERHTVPSPHTSWLAIPEEERRNFADSIKRSRLTREYNLLAREIERRGASSPTALRIVARLKSRARTLGIDLRAWGENTPAFSTAVSGIASRWMAAVERHGESSATARRLRDDLVRMQEIGASDGTLTGIYRQKAEEAARQLLLARRTGRPDLALRRKTDALARFSATSRKELLAATVASEGRDLAEQVLGGGSNAAESNTILGELERSAERPRGRYVYELRKERAETEAGGYWQEIDRELSSATPDHARLREANRKRLELLRPYPDAPRTTPSPGMHLAGRLGDKVRTGTVRPGDYEAVERQARELSSVLDIPFNADELNHQLRYTVPYALLEVESARRDQEMRARRDPVRLAETRRISEAMRSAIPTSFLDDLDRNISRQVTPRDRVVGALREGRRDERATEEYLRGSETRRDRLRLLEMNVELDRLDRRAPLTAEETARKAALERDAAAIWARVGDPVIVLDAPRTARDVHARLPDGTRVEMTWTGARWEGRFDIPAGTAEGPYPVRVGADGRLVRTDVLRVDMTPPTFRTSIEGEAMRVIAERDTARATLLDGDRRVALGRVAPGRFAGPAPRSPDWRVVVTDRAHNRSDGLATPAAEAPAGEVAAPSVQAMAAYAGRVWVSTLNEGGRWDDGEAAPEVGAWPRGAVEAGGRLWVRTSTGGLFAYDGKTWTDRSAAPRAATSVAADGDRVLVGRLGGWSEITREDLTKHHFPAGLAGVRTTCLMPDGDRLWIGTQGRGLAEVDRRSGVVKWHDERGGLGDDWVTALGRDSAGRIVIGTFVAGAYRRDILGWTAVPGTAGTCVTALLGDLVGTRSGLFENGIRVAGGEVQALLATPKGIRVATRTGVSVR